MTHLLLLKIVSILLCVSALRFRMWQRSITMCIILTSVTLWAVTSDYIGDYSIYFIVFGLIMAFIRAMFKPKIERIFYV